MSEAPLPMEWPEFAVWLLGQGYQAPTKLDDRTWAALSPKLFTTAIVTGEIGDETGVGDAWCYETHSAALSAPPYLGSRADAGAAGVVPAPRHRPPPLPRARRARRKRPRGPGRRGVRAPMSATSCAAAGGAGKPAVGRAEIQESEMTTT